MADIYDVNAAIAKPNVLNAYRQGVQFKEASQDRAAAAHEKQLKQLRGAAQYMKQALQTGNPAAVSGAWQAVRPFLAQAGGQEPPAEWSPDMEARMEQALAQTAYLDQAALAGAPSGIREFEAKARAAGLVPGSPEYQEAANIALGRSPRAVTGAMKFDTATDLQGNIRPRRANPTTGLLEEYRAETGVWVPLGGPAGGGVPAPAAPTSGAVFESNGRPITIGADIDPRIAAAIAANPDAAGVANNIRLPEQAAGVGATPGIGQSKAAEAGASERAKLQAQLDALPAELAARTQADLDLETGKAALKEQAALTEQASESEGKLNQIRDRQNMVTSAIDDALAAPGFDAAFGIDYARGFVPNTDARNARLRVNTVTNQIRLNVLSDLKALSPTGGAVGQVSNEEGRVMEGYLGQLDWTLSDAEARRTMEKIKERMATMSSRLEAAAAKDRAAAQGAYAPAAPAGEPAAAAAGWSIEQVN
ncbi:MAG TPA: hypothetical protein VFH85_07785 [Gammaproteobacteria bacterium]|nr:hypothetical protein [Gammaproteobacteria bacterium]